MTKYALQQLLENPGQDFMTGKSEGGNAEARL